MRVQLSEIFTLVKEAWEEDHEGYFNYFRMSPNQFAGLFIQFGKAINLEVQQKLLNFLYFHHSI